LIQRNRHQGVAGRYGEHEVRVHGMPPERVVGSSIKTRFDDKTRNLELIRLPEVDVINDKAGKPVGINRFIGQCPIAAFGNSDGDLRCRSGRHRGQHDAWA
jgi:hypothetical protein